MKKLPACLHTCFFITTLIANEEEEEDHHSYYQQSSFKDNLEFETGYCLKLKSWERWASSLSQHQMNQELMVILKSIITKEVFFF